MHNLELNAQFNLWLNLKQKRNDSKQNAKNKNVNCKLFEVDLHLFHSGNSLVHALLTCRAGPGRYAVYIVIEKKIWTLCSSMGNQMYMRLVSIFWAYVCVLYVVVFVVFVDFHITLLTHFCIFRFDVYIVLDFVAVVVVVELTFYTDFLKTKFFTFHQGLLFDHPYHPDSQFFFLLGNGEQKKGLHVYRLDIGLFLELKL